MFSKLLSTFRLTAEIYNNSQLCGQWQVHAHSDGLTCFHMVTIGRCRMLVPNIGEFELELGDLVVFPREIPHTMLPFEGAPETQFKTKIFTPDSSKYGTGLLCGTLNFEHQGFNHILDALPKVFIIKQHDAKWIKPLLMQIQDEVFEQVNSDKNMLNRLSELLFVYALRHHMQQHGASGVFTLFASIELAPALQLMRDHPDKNWSLEQFGKACSMSRTKFSQLFKKVSGYTVNEFFTWWRMQLAFDYLRQGQRITQVSEQVGYASESAFSRAFKKCFAINPSDV